MSRTLTCTARWSQRDANPAHFQGSESWLRSVAAAAAFDITPHLPSRQPRTLVLATHDNTLVPLQRSRMLAEAMPSAATVTIAPCGGHAMNVTEAEDFNNTPLDFLRHG